MLVTAVVRLHPERLAAGEFVGEVEHVATGRKQTFRSLIELGSHLRGDAEDKECTT